MPCIVEEAIRGWRAAAQARLTLRVDSGEGAKKGGRNVLLSHGYQALCAIAHCVGMPPHP